MKNKLFTLYKAISFDNYKLNNFRRKGNILKTSARSLLTVFIFFMILGYSALYSYMGFDFLKGQGLEKYVLIGFFLVASLFVFMTSVYRSKSMLFDSKDNDILFSMPIKSSTIFFSRVLNLLSINYVAAAFVFLPCVVMYSIFVKVSLVYYLIAFIVYIFLPFIPTVIASIIGYLIAILTSKTRNKKMFETIFTLAFVGLIMYVSGIFPSIVGKLIKNIGSVDKFMSTYGFVIDQMQKAIFNTDLIALLIFAVINIGIMYIFVKILSTNYKGIINRLKEVSTKRSKNKKLDYKINSVMSSLLKKEVKRYFSIPVYLINTAFGVIMLLIATIANTFFGSDMINQIFAQEGIAGSSFDMLILFTTFVVGLSNTACSSISLEGNTLWILKSLPINTKQIFNSKILLNILVVLPITILCILILGITLGLSPVQIMLNLIIVSILCLVVSQFGLIINLKIPKLEYVSEIQVVKQSMSTFISTFTPIVVLFCCIFLYQYIFSKFMGLESYVICVSAILLIIAFVENQILNKWGKKAFMNL